MDVHRGLRALNADPAATDKDDANFAMLEAVLVLLLGKEGLANVDCIFARDWNLAVPPLRTIWAIECWLRELQEGPQKTDGSRGNREGGGVQEVGGGGRRRRRLVHQHPSTYLPRAVSPSEGRASSSPPLTATPTPSRSPKKLDSNTTITSAVAKFPRFGPAVFLRGLGLGLGLGLKYSGLCIVVYV
ncbi:hypothetical protein TrLO_g387 [Triparma laevis f. longispina]|uniref:Uncharacterized protein n=1 Tax=Triparma laevis f. longispina TaxID=1714387 RepID=A0A9W7F9Z8_9STRA|nr:hypothetical protein TrLO_g387 [Triparma laevis f. longispina]